jgi:hydrogenase maturation protein HypF
MLPTCSGEAIATWVAMLKRGINVPLTSSAGRLFDAVASLVGIRHVASFEGQAAMELEYAIAGVETDECYGFSVVRGSNDQEAPKLIDWAPMIREILRDLSVETPAATIAARFHNTLVEMIVEVARLVGVEQVALTGGCFQNAYLLERSVRRLIEEGFRPYWHRLVPPNDGGIALGQIVAASLAVETAPQGPLEG